MREIDIDDVFEVDEEMPYVDGKLLERLIEDLKECKKELNEYHIRDAEMENWVSIPHERYVYFLGLEAENMALTLINEDLMDEQEDEEDKKPVIVQPPEDYGFPDFNSTESTSDPLEYDASGTTRPMQYRDTIILSEGDITTLVNMVYERLRESDRIS